MEDAKEQPDREALLRRTRKLLVSLGMPDEDGPPLGVPLVPPLSSGFVSWSSSAPANSPRPSRAEGVSAPEAGKERRTDGSADADRAFHAGAYPSAG